jgi:hypothetical protein
MAEHCPECGAPIPEEGSCRDNFHALLLLESEISGRPGALAHFYAVACYGLQHPDGMNYTADALAGLRAGVADLLDARVTLDGLRRRTRRAVNGAVRVTRRAGDAAVPWRRGRWPMTVADILTVAADRDAYAVRVLRWASSVPLAGAARGPLVRPGPGVQAPRLPPPVPRSGVPPAPGGGR